MGRTGRCRTAFSTLIPEITISDLDDPFDSCAGQTLAGRAAPHRSHTRAAGCRVRPRSILRVFTTPWTAHDPGRYRSILAQLESSGSSARCLLEPAVVSGALLRNCHDGRR